jgi:fibronectin-binding autotransporter adhesin
MKSISQNPVFLALLAFGALGIPAARAESLYWSANGSTAGGGGQWDTGTANWGISPAGPFLSAWSNFANDTALFTGSTGPVELTEGIVVGGLGFHANGFVIEASAHPLSFGAADNSILLAGNANATITGAVGGAGNVAIGPLPVLGRVLTLNGTSTGGWTGTTTVHPGSTLALAGSSQALLDTWGITLNGGGVTLTNTAASAALDRVGDLAAITANGGVFTFANPSDGNTYAETVGAVALVLGQTGFALSTNQAGGGSQTLTLSGLDRSDPANTSSVTFSAAGTAPNASANQLVVTGAVETPASQIVGPWATTGTSPLVQTDYAVFDGSARVLPANIAASTEDTWTDSTQAYTSAEAAVSLAGDRSMAALRNTGATATITLSDGTTGHTLATNGILNAVNSQLTIAPGTVAGALTAPGTGGGHLYINTGGSRAFGLTTNNNTIAANLSIDLSAPITDNGGPVTLVKTGDTSVLRLTGTKNYSGGTVVNAGILFVESDAALGASSGKLTLNGGQLRCINNNTTFSREIEIGPAGGSFAGIGNQTNINFNGKLTGGGAFNMVDTGGAGGRVAFFNAKDNDFTGAIFIPTNACTVRFNSLPDSPGAGDIILYRGGQSSQATFQYGAGAEVPLILDHRSVQIVNTSGSPTTSTTVSNLNTSQAVTINTDLVSIGSTARTLVLDAAAGPLNLFAGDLADGSGGGVLGINKTGAGTWAVSGENSYTGITTVSAGTLVANSIENGGTPGSIGAANSQSGNLILLGGTLKYEPIAGDGGAAATTDRNFIIRASSTIDASGTGALEFSQTGTVSPDVTGLTGTFTAGNATVADLPSTANLAVGMTVTSDAYTGTKTISSINSASSITLNNNTGIAGGSFPINAGTPAARTLTLAGTNADGNTIAGVLRNSSATGTGVLGITKSGTGTWVLAGDNTYTGATTVDAGTLLVNGDQSAATGAVAVNGTSTLGGAGTLGGPVTVAAGANLAPGASVGTLAIGGGLNLSSMAGGAGTLAFELGPVAASDLITVGGTLSIGTDVLGFNDFVFDDLAGLHDGTYKLITSNNPVSGTLDPGDLSGPVGAGTGSLQISGSGTDIELVVSGLGGLTGYALWASENAPSGDPDDDYDGDGVANALEYVLGGDKESNDLARLPAAAAPDGNLTFTFVRDQASLDGSTTVAIEVGTDLAAWPDSYAVGTDTAGSSAGVTVQKNIPVAGFDTVTLTVTREPDVRKFGRLKVTVVTP